MYSGRLGCFQEEHNNVVTTGTNHNANIWNHEEQLSHSVASDPAVTGQVNCRTMVRLIRSLAKPDSRERWLHTTM